jgi:hypothetical protein
MSVCGFLERPDFRVVALISNQEREALLGNSRCWQRYK